MPEDKYGVRRGHDRTGCLDVAAVLMSFPGLGEAAVHELLRRLVVNELLGNPDMHLKNIGLIYPDGVAPALSPAYDVVAYAAFGKTSGHALQLLPHALLPRSERPAPGAPRARQALSPALLRAFCEALGIPERPAASALREAVRRAVAQWPALIEAAGITPLQKQRLLAHFHGHAMVQSLARRARAR
jgi:serine/threonine-protein kinase HipA